MIRQYSDSINGVTSEKILYTTHSSSLQPIQLFITTNNDDCER